MTNIIEIKSFNIDSTKQNEYRESKYIHTYKQTQIWAVPYIYIYIKNKYFYVFRRFFARNDDVSWIDVSINGLFLLSNLTLTKDDFDDFIFSISSNENGSGFIRIVNLGIIRRDDDSPGLWCSLSVFDDREVIEDELEWRLERIVGRQIRKLGLFEFGVVDIVVDDDEYWDKVRWRPLGYVGDVDENEEDDDVDNVGERRRVGRIFEDTVEVCLFVTVDEREFELIPSEPIAESVVDGWFRIIVTGDFDRDECELLGRRRDVNLFEIDNDCDEEFILIFVFFFEDS